MGYENAPATAMIAVYCACCSKELLDAASVEAGLGPHCRAKHGVPSTLTEEARVEANQLVFAIACQQDDCEEVREMLRRLDALGCTVLVDRISKRLYGKPIYVQLEGSKLVVKSPFSHAFLASAKAIRSRRWNGEDKRTEFDPRDHAAVAAALVDGYRAGTRVFVGDSETACALTLDMLDALCAGYTPAPTPPKPPTPVKVVRDHKRGRVTIWCPYLSSVVAGMKAITGRRWDSANRANTFPIAAEAEVIALIRAGFDTIQLVEQEL